MNITPKIHRHLLANNMLFYVLLIIVIGLVAQFSIKTNLYADWTADNRHSLSVTTKEFLKSLDQDIAIDIFVSPSHQYHSVIETLLSRYLRHTDKLIVRYINPDFSPKQVRDLNIQQQGEMVISLGEKTHHVYDLSEQSLTNGLIIVSRHQQPWIVFIEGHGERSPFGQANFDFSIWGEQLKQKGFKLQSLNLIDHPQLPNNAAVVVIASPQLPWLEGEIELIKSYISNGGHLLWLTEPNTSDSLANLSEQLGLEFIPGTIIDPNAELLGISDPEFVLVANYAHHAIGQATTSVTLFPQASAIEVNDNDTWDYTPLLQSSDTAWNDSQPTNTQASKPYMPNFDPTQDTAGPLVLGYLLTQSSNQHTDNNVQQRIAVVGDGDFLSNAYIGNGANLELGIATMNWLAGDDNVIAIPLKTTIDNQLELTQTQSLIIGLGFLIGLPIVLLGIGSGVWWYRQKQ